MTSQKFSNRLRTLAATHNGNFARLALNRPYIWYIGSWRVAREEQPAAAAGESRGEERVRVAAAAAEYE